MTVVVLVLGFRLRRTFRLEFYLYVLRTGRETGGHRVVWERESGKKRVSFSHCFV